MASVKERDRWERWFGQMVERVNRQKESITRLVLLLTEARAALLEIAEMPAGAGVEAAGRAQASIERMDEIAAATLDSAKELVSEALPEDPRRKH